VRKIKLQEFLLEILEMRMNINKIRRKHNPNVSYMFKNS